MLSLRSMDINKFSFTTCLLRQPRDSAYGIMQHLIIQQILDLSIKIFENDFNDNINLQLQNKIYNVTYLLTFILKINKNLTNTNVSWNLKKNLS